MAALLGARRRYSTHKSPERDDVPTSQPPVPTYKPNRQRKIPPPFSPPSRRQNVILDEFLSESPAADATTFPRPRSSALPFPVGRPSGRFVNYGRRESDRKRTRAKTQPDLVDDLQAKFTPAKSSRVWERYVKKVEDKDKDLVEDWDRVIDVTLVFAALFSAMTTAFVLESAKNLQLDPSKATVSAILNLTSTMQGGISTSTGAEVSQPDPITIEVLEESYEPTKATIWVNCLWFLSLGISVSVSLFAMLAKRWSYVFRVRSRHFGTSYERAIKRQESWDAIKRWKMELVIEHLPTLMHVSLLLFFTGLVIYLAEIHKAPMIVTATLAGLVLALYWLLTVLPAWFPNCPMVTPFTRVSGTWHSHIVRFFRSVYRWTNPYNIFSWCQQTLSQLPEMQQKRKGIFSIPTFFRKMMTGTPRLTALATLLATEQHGLDGNLVPYSPPHEHKEHRQAFRALVWMLRTTKDKDIKEVLEHATNFPEVILTSYTNHKRLYEAFLMLAEYMNRLQHETAELDTKETDIQRCKVLCGRLIYLTKKYHLRLSNSEDPSVYPHLESIEELSELYPAVMFPNELEDRLEKIQKADTLADYLSWLESFAARQAFNHPSEASLDMCVALSRNILEVDGILKPSSHPNRPFVIKAQPTLWWIFLIDTLEYTAPVPLRGHPQDKTILFDRVLTWNHLRDSAMRDSNAPWLTVVGISGMLRAFNHYPEHRFGPIHVANDDYFRAIIQILRDILFTTLVTDSCDPFIGGIPVFCGTKVQLYEFDSLQYAYDALKSVSKSPIYRAHFGDIERLSRDIHTLRSMRRTMSSWLDDDFDLTRVEDHYDSIIAAELPPSIWLASGLLRCTSSFRLDPARARFLSKLIPDILFSPSTSIDLQLTNNQSGMTESSIATEKYIEGIHHIAALVWMPFSCDSHASKFRATLQGTKDEYMRHDDLWDLLCHAGVLRTDDKYLSSLKPKWNHTDNSLYFSQNARSDALGCSLRIKAAMVERLYSLRASNHTHYSLDVLGWYSALAYHFSKLLKYWNNAKLDPDEEAYVISSLMYLTNTLLAAIGDVTPKEPKFVSSPSGAKSDDLAPAACSQLESLVASGVLQRLARPFSVDFSLNEKNDETGKFEWYQELAETIDHLARKFAFQALQFDHSTEIYNDMVAYFKRQSSPVMVKFTDELRQFMKQKWVLFLRRLTMTPLLNQLFTRS